MAFQIPRSKRSVKQNRFEFTDEDGRAHELPLLKYLPVEAAELMEQEKVVSALIVACDNDGTRAAVRALDGEQLEALVEAWQEASGVSAGESPASADS